MTSSLKYQVDKTNPEENVHRVQFQIIDAENIPRSVFVFDTENQNYLHVGTIFDLESWPNNREDAVTDNKSFYRGNTVTRDFSNIADALNFETITKTRIKILVISWNKNVDSFTGTDIVTVIS